MRGIGHVLASGAPSVPRCLAQETKSRAVAFAPSPAGKSGTFPDRRSFAWGNSLTPDSVRPLSPALVYIAHGCTGAEQAYGLLS